MDHVTTRWLGRTGLGLVVGALTLLLTGCHTLGFPGPDTYNGVEEIAKELDVQSLGEIVHDGRDPGPYAGTPTLEYVILGGNLYPDAASRARGAGFDTDGSTFPIDWTRDAGNDWEDSVTFTRFESGDVLHVLDDAPFGGDTTEFTATQDGLIVSIVGFP